MTADPTILIHVPVPLREYSSGAVELPLAAASVREALEAALADHAALLDRHQHIHDTLHGASAQAEARLFDELQTIEHQLERWGWDLAPRLKTAATTWGLEDLDAEVETLSGGWRKRVARLTSRRSADFR